MTTTEVNQVGYEGFCKTEARIIKYEYKWVICDYSYTVERNRGLRSADFCVDGYPMKGFLKVFADDEFDEELFGPLYYKHLLLDVYLGTDRNPLHVDIVCSVLDSNGKRYSISHSYCTRNMSITNAISFDPFINRAVIYESKLIQNDTMTILCEISIMTNIVTNTYERNLQFLSPEYSLVNEMADLLKSSKFADIEIKAGSKKFDAHKSILAARSPVFAAMLETKMKESEENYIDITDLSEDVVKEMLLFIYTDTTTKLDEMTIELLDAAEKYDLKNLKALCEQSFRKRLNVQNAAETLIIADRYNVKDIRDYILRFISTHRQCVIETDGYKLMEQTHVHLVIEAFKAISFK